MKNLFFAAFFALVYFSTNAQTAAGEVSPVVITYEQNGTPNYSWKGYEGTGAVQVGYEPKETDEELERLAQEANKNKSKKNSKSPSSSKKKSNKTTLTPTLLKASKGMKKFTSVLGFLLDKFQENGQVTFNSSHVVDGNGNVISDISSVSIGYYSQGLQQYYQITITDNNGNKEWAIMQGENMRN